MAQIVSHRDGTISVDREMELIINWSAPAQEAGQPDVLEYELVDLVQTRVTTRDLSVAEVAKAVWASLNDEERKW